VSVSENGHVRKKHSKKGDYEDRLLVMVGDRKHLSLLLLLVAVAAAAAKGKQPDECDVERKDEIAKEEVPKIRQCSSQETRKKVDDDSQTRKKKRWD